MTTGEIVLIITLIAVLAAAVIISSVYLMCMIPYIEAKKFHEQSMENESKSRLDVSIIEYSNSMLDFIRQFAVDYSVLKYEEYQNNTYMDKVNKANLENVIGEIAHAVKDALYEKNINYDKLLFTDDLINMLICDVCIHTVRELFERSEHEAEAADVI